MFALNKVDFHISTEDKIILEKATSILKSFERTKNICDIVPGEQTINAIIEGESAYNIFIIDLTNKKNAEFFRACPHFPSLIQIKEKTILSTAL